MTSSLEPMPGDPPEPGEPPEPEAIFVVGVSRSGTTLLRRVLSSHSRIAIADENHYLGHLLPRSGVRAEVRRAGDLARDEVVHALVQRLYSDEFRRGTRLRQASPFWGWLARRVPPAELEQRILDGERSERGVFTALLRSHADRRKRAIMGEKTPAHLRSVETLLEWYPRARVVHILRDPRAVFVSEVKRRMKRPESVPYRWLVGVPAAMRAFILLEVAWAWADAVARDRRLARRYPAAYRLVRFEDLVRDPATQVPALCTFLGVPFEPAMLEQKVVSQGAREGEAGFDAGAADRWRAQIAPRDASALRRLLGRRLERHGYTA